MEGMTSLKNPGTFFLCRFFLSGSVQSPDPSDQTSKPPPWAVTLPSWPEASRRARATGATSRWRSRCPGRPGPDPRQDPRTLRSGSSGGGRRSGAEWFGGFGDGERMDDDFMAWKRLPSTCSWEMSDLLLRGLQSSLGCPMHSAE